MWKSAETCARARALAAAGVGSGAGAAPERRCPQARHGARQPQGRQLECMLATKY